MSGFQESLEHESAQCLLEAAGVPQTQQSVVEFETSVRSLNVITITTLRRTSV